MYKEKNKKAGTKRTTYIYMICMYIYIYIYI